MVDGCLQGCHCLRVSQTAEAGVVHAQQDITLLQDKNSTDSKFQVIEPDLVWIFGIFIEFWAFSSGSFFGQGLQCSGFYHHMRLLFWEHSGIRVTDWCWGNKLLFHPSSSHIASITFRIHPFLWNIGILYGTHKSFPIMPIVFFEIRWAALYSVLFSSDVCLYLKVNWGRRILWTKSNIFTENP